MRRLAATRTDAVLRRPFRLSGLPGQRLAEHFFGQDLANGRNRLFQLAELGSPGRPRGTIDAIHQTFCHALYVGEFFVYSLSCFFLLCHPWPLQVLESRKMGNLTQEYTIAPHKAAKRVAPPKINGWPVSC